MNMFFQLFGLQRLISSRRCQEDTEVLFNPKYTTPGQSRKAMKNKSGTDCSKTLTKGALTTHHISSLASATECPGNYSKFEINYLLAFP